MAGSAEIQGSMAGSSGALGQIAGTVLGLMTANYNDNRQKRMNRELIEQQMIAGKQMGRFNQQLALEMWDKTNYEAQRKHMEKAGLNPALMYGSAGQGGTTQGGRADMPSSSTAPTGGGEIGMGMQIGLQAQMMAAQVQLMKSQAANLDQDTANKAGGEGTGGAQKENLMQLTTNARVQQTLTEYQTEIAQIERDIKAGTKQEAMTAIKQAVESTAQTIRSQKVGAEVSEATKDSIIQQLNKNAVEQALRIEGAKKGLIKQDADTAAVNTSIQKMSQEIYNMIQEQGQKWKALSQEDQRLMIQKRLMQFTQQSTEFNTSTPQQIGQWVELIGDILTAGILKF